MLGQLKKLYSVLSTSEKKNLFLVQAVLILMSVAELATVTLVPLFFMILDKGKIPNDFLQSCFIQMGLFQNGEPQTLSIATFFFVLILLANCFLMLGNFIIFKFSAELGISFAHSIFKFYMSKDYIYHSRHNKAEFINDIVIETGRLQGGVIYQLLILISKSLVIFLVVGNLLLSKPVLTISIVSVISVIYFIFYKVIRKMLAENGVAISTSSVKSQKYLNEAFGSIKELKIYKKEYFFVERHKRELSILLFKNAENATWSLIPKYFFETLAFGGVCFFLITMSNENSLEASLSTLALYALSAYKLMPSAQQIFGSMATIKSNIHVVDTTVEKIKEGKDLQFELNFQSQPPPKKEIVLKDICFSYDGKTDQLKNISMELPVGKKIAFVGLSGSGKTTTANILLGLLKPSRGELIVDGTPVDFNKLSGWYNNLSFVPQSIYLMDSSVADNISFGEQHESPDKKKLEVIAQRSNLSDFISNLPEKFDTFVGDDGVKLSGGQKQRLGIARALYLDRPIIVMDEATSALDNVNENEIMRNIQSIQDKTIVIIAHRLSTIRCCDTIFVFDNGKVVASGTYDELQTRSPDFQKLIHGHTFQ